MTALLCLMASACTGQKRMTGYNNSASVESDTVPYATVNNYFVRNDADSVPTVITSEAQLEQYFGMAAYMGKGGEPTEIDFSKRFVIAVALPETDISTEIYPASLTGDANRELVFTCRMESGDRQSYTIRPFTMIMVDKQYEAPVRVVMRYAPSVLIAYYDASVGKDPLLDAVKAQHAEIIYDYKNINAVAIRVSDGRSAEQVIRSLEKVKGVLSVAKDGKQTLHQAG